MTWLDHLEACDEHLDGVLVVLREQRALLEIDVRALAAELDRLDEKIRECGWLL